MTSSAAICRKEAALRQREVMGMGSYARLFNLDHCVSFNLLSWTN
jgi:hypothetical protein